MTKKQQMYIDDIREKMRSLNVYKPEFEKTIVLLSEKYIDVEKARREFRKSGGHYTVPVVDKNGNVTYQKNVQYRAIEDMESAILQTQRELGLTPKGLKALQAKTLEVKATSKLDEALNKLG